MTTKILIADDDPQILRALRVTLGAKGYEILTAGDGALRLYVSQLRKKLEPNPSSPRYIITEAGMGYRLQLDD